MYKRRMKLTREQVLQIAGAAQCDPRTVVKIYDGRATKTLVRERIAVAAKSLKLTPPPTIKK